MHGNIEIISLYIPSSLDGFIYVKWKPRHIRIHLIFCLRKTVCVYAHEHTHEHVICARVWYVFTRL